MKTKSVVLAACGVMAVAAAIVITSTSGKKESPENSAPVHVSRKVREERGGGASRWSSLADPSLTRNQRLEITRTIRLGMPDGEVEELFALLRHVPSPADADMWSLVANQIMEEMRKNGVGAEVYTERLSSLALDPKVGEVIRDYAIQHLGQWLAPAIPESMPGERNPSARLVGFRAISSAIKDPVLAETSVPGTGLLTLADADGKMSEGEKQAIRGELAGFLSDLITGKLDASPILRASAVQYAARTGQESFRPAIRSLVERGGSDPSLRLSSIHALGVFARTEDQSLLRSLASTDNLFQYAAKAALQNFGKESSR